MSKDKLLKNTERMIDLLNQIIDLFQKMESELGEGTFTDDQENFILKTKSQLEDFETEMEDQKLDLSGVKSYREKYLRKVKEDPDWGEAGHGGFFG